MTASQAAGQATVKLYASLMAYLPAGAKDQSVQMPLEQDATIGAMLAAMRVPQEKCHLVLVNGVFVPPGARETQRLNDGDTLAVWPPVAGG